MGAREAIIREPRAMFSDTANNADMLDGQDSTDFMPYGTETLGGLGCTTDQIAKWDGAAWVCSTELADLQTTVTNLQTEHADLQADVAELKSLLTHFSRVDDEVIITGANLNIVSRKRRHGCHCKRPG